MSPLRHRLSLPSPAVDSFLLVYPPPYLPLSVLTRDRPSLILRLILRFKFHGCPFDRRLGAEWTSFCPVSTFSILAETNATCTKTYNPDGTAAPWFDDVTDSVAQRNAARATALPLILERWKHGPAKEENCGFYYSSRTELALHLENDHNFAAREQFLVPGAQLKTFVVLIHRYLCVEFNCLKPHSKVPWELILFTPPCGTRLFSWQSMQTYFCSRLTSGLLSRR